MTMTRLELIAYKYKYELMCFNTDALPFYSLRVYHGNDCVDIDIEHEDRIYAHPVSKIPKALLKACISFASTPVDERKYKRFNQLECIKLERKHVVSRKNRLE